MRGFPPPERLVTKRSKAGAARMLGDSALPKEWQAGVSKVEACSLAEYDGGRGLKTIFPKKEDPKRRCNILCIGSTNELTISLELAERHQDPYAHVLHRFDLPNDDDRIGLRLYDVDVSIEIREHPRNPKQRKSTRRAETASGECWVIHLETSLKEQVLVKAKTMLRRLESVTNAMHSDCFSYRNCFVKHTSGEPANDSNVEFGDGVFTQTFVGGFTWRFTGNLASKEFREALAGKLADGKAREEVPTRLQPYRTAKGKKAAKKTPGKQLRLGRVQQRSLAADESPKETPEPVVEQEDEIEQPAPSSPAAFSSEPELDDQESGESDVALIEGLLDKRTRDGEVEFEVQWTGPYKPTWEPAANVTAESIAEFEKNKAGKAKKRKGRPPNSKQTTTTMANAPKTRSAGNAARKSAK